MEVILPRESEIDRQLLPGSVMRDINLVESVAELRKQMEESNSAIVRTRRRIMIVSAILAIGALFFAFKSEPVRTSDVKDYLRSTSDKARTGLSNRAKLAKYLKLMGTALAVLSLIKATSQNKINVVPSTKDFSEQDKEYSVIHKINDIHSNSPFMQLVVKAILDVLIASKMIEPYEVKQKQRELRNTQSADLDANIMKAIIQY